MRYGIIKDHNGNSHKFAKVILGSVPFGTTMPEEQAFQEMDYYRSQGGNVIDTAMVYCEWLPNGLGVSERTVGKWIKDRKCREEFFIVTKGGHPKVSDMAKSRLSREDINHDVQGSLNNLQSDYIDLYFLHRDDETIPVKLIMDTLHEWVSSGKIRMLGASNWSVERILEANEYAKANGKTPFIASQIQWSFAYATAKEMFGDPTMLCMDDKQYMKYLQAGIPVLAYTSQANGVFSCGYKPDLSDIADKHKKYYCEENIRRYQELLKICDEKKISPTQAALEYITDNELNAFAIIGCSNMEQLRESLNIERG